MGGHSFVPIEPNETSRNDLVERGFTRQPLRVDVEVARTLEALSHAAWSIPRDKYYDGGDRYRSLNRLRGEIVEGGVKVCLGIVKIHTLSERMRVWNRGIAVSGCRHPFSQRLDIIDLVCEMIHAGYALIRRPAFLRFDSRLTERDVGFVSTYMYPTGAVVASPFASNVEFRKGSFQEPDHRIHVADANVRMFKPSCHRIPPRPGLCSRVVTNARYGSARRFSDARSRSFEPRNQMDAHTALLVIFDSSDHSEPGQKGPSTNTKWCFSRTSSTNCAAACPWVNDINPCAKPQEPPTTSFV